MNRKEIIHMAREAGLEVGWVTQIDPDRLEIFATLVAEHEREECAKLAQATVCDIHIPTGIKIYGTKVAKAIRSKE